MDYKLQDLNLLKVSTKDSGENTGIFEIEPLSPGYGITIGNTLRRILLSSLEGFAIKSVKIAGVDHEYSVLKGMKEDVVELILNLKMVRFKINTESDEPIKVELSVKGPKKVTSDDFKTNANIEVVSKGLYLCTLEKGGKLDLTVEVDRGRGYVPVEKRADEQVSIGTILIDSIYTPVKKVKFDVENARVGGMTNYNKLTMEISTDGAITPSEAIKTASEIMKEHLEVIIAATAESTPKKAAKKKAEPAGKSPANGAKKAKK